ncbi:MAG: hypothetical protein JOS17DRAFT_786953 [Linnemannia elongata]|nr:MAG: hypothetical protein JOS17DRAFT_786953 [Linnemannia elongata]
MSTIATNRALAIPEILRAIAINIPLFTTNPLPSSSSQGFLRSPHDITLFQATEPGPGFIPLDLLNCCLVCKTWREILVPVLWRCFDERFMWRVPQEVLVRYRRHVRYFRGKIMPLTKGEVERHWQLEQEGQVLSEDIDWEEKNEDDKESMQLKQKEEEEGQCTSLVELDVFFFGKSGWGKVVHTSPPPAYARVLYLNRHLRKIRLTAHEAKPQPINATALSRCLRLKELSINSFTTQVSLEKDLGLFLRPVASTLTLLILINIRGEYALDTTPSTTATQLWFPHVVEFRTDLSSQVTPGIEELIARCPNLERLYLSPDPSLSLEPLATLLHFRRQNGSDTYTCCPKIHSLMFLSPTSEANQIHKVIEACGALTQLEYKCNNLTQEIQQATRAHRATLEHFKMSIIFCRPRSTTATTAASITTPLPKDRVAAGRAQTNFLQEVVDSFLSLRLLVFRDFRQLISQADFAETMMERPWRCDRLEELQLVVGIMDRGKDVEMECYEPGRVFAHGWRVPMDVPVDRTYLKPNYVLFEQFLDHVSVLPVLRKMTALRVDCVR